jgi:hypothetical protein
MNEKISNFPVFQTIRFRRLILLTLMSVFFFFYVAMEFTIVSFLAVYGVKSRLALSNQEAALLLVYYLGPFLLMRVIIIFLAMKIRPIHILAMNLVFCLTGALVNVIVLDSSVLATKIAFGLVGFGTSSMFGNSMIWIEEYVKVRQQRNSIRPLV